MFKKRRKTLFTFFILLISVLVVITGQSTVPLLQADTITFTGGELLGKPTDTSITVNIVPDADIEYYYEYGTIPGTYTGQTTPVTAVGGQPHEVVITGLSPNTRYYYRMVYDGDGDVDDSDFEVRAEHTFHTQRAEGSSYIFTITSDAHATFNTNHQQAMINVLNDNPDFNLDLGDTFYVDNTSSQSAVNADYLAFRDPLYMGRIGPSVPIFLTPGNHEEEEGWNLDDTPFSSGVGSIQARKAFFPTPINDGFYFGSTDPLPAIDEVTYGDEFRENYYAWEWGDALFVVIDEYQYTMDLPYSPAAGEGSDDPVTGDQWSWTLGEEQFNWFKQIIQNSDARYKFVFSHHMLGGTPEGGPFADPGYVRGGAGAAPYFEWGGQDGDGDWEFTTLRNEADFGTMPIHQIMAGNGVSAYFHGHDHQYVYEQLDGVVYQEVPSPSMAGSGFSGIYDEADPFTIEIQPSTGHLRITVTPTEVTVDYVRSDQTGVTYAYEIEPNDASTVGYTIAATAGANGSITTGGMTTYGTVTVSAGNNQTFTITPDSGYQVSDVLVDGVSVGVVPSYEFTNVQADHTIEARFVAGGPDTTPPVITLLGNAEMYVNIGDMFTGPGATANDNVDGDITDNIVVGGDTVDTSTLGDYTITYDVQDAAGNPATQVTRTVHVVEAGAPGTPLYRVNCGGDTLDMDPDPDFAALHFDDLTSIPGLAVGGITAEGSTTDNINLDNVDPGLSEALFQTLLRTGTSGDQSMTFDFDVSNGEYNVLLHWAEHNDSYAAPGQRVFDVFVEGVEVLPDYEIGLAAGGADIAVTEIVHTIVSDGVLNLGIARDVSVAIIRGIEIVPVETGPDMTPPVITLNGDAEMTVEQGDTFTDPGAIASDNVDGDITSDIVVGGDVVDTSTLGESVITYDVQDAAGNDAVQVTRTVHVVYYGTPLYRVNCGGDALDMDPDPDFSALHYSDLTTIPGLTVDGITAEGSTTDSISLNNVDPGLPEALFQTILRTGESGDQTMTFDFDVPNGEYAVLLHWAEHNSDFTDPGDRVFDVFIEGVEILPDYDIVVAAGGEDTAVTESVRTIVSDGILNLGIARDVSVAIIRGIEIVPVSTGTDTTSPVITLLGNAVVAVNLGSTYNDAGATAMDDVDGDITVDINAVNPVDTNIIGLYEITYNVSDTAGNAATEVTRTVYVIENGTPLYRVNNGGPDIPMIGEADFLGIDSSTLDAIPGLNAYGEFAADVTITDPINMDNVNSGLPEALFQSLMRTSATTGDVINFDFSVPNGDYDVLLHWAEHNDTIGEGERLFDVSIEGVLVLDNYDIFFESGGEDIAITETEATTVNDGVLNLAIAQQTSVAIIRGIEIVPTDVPTAVTLDSFSEAANGQWQLTALSVFLVIGMVILTYKLVQQKRKRLNS